MLNDSRVAFVGSGAMAEAMIRGLLRQGMVAPEQIVASGPRAERGQALSDQYAVRVTTDNVEAVRGPTWLSWR